MAIVKYRLYDENDRLNEDGKEFSKRVGYDLELLIEKWHKVGYSLRDMQTAIADETSIIVLSKIIA